MSYDNDNMTALGKWEHLTGLLQHKLYQIERYAGLTLIALFPPENYQKDQDELAHDWQSVGAQMVNHLANKMMLALFAPSRPFFRLDPSAEVLAQASANGLEVDKLQEVLSLAEKAAVKELDKRSVRPKLFQLVKHLIVTGNALLDLSRDDDMRVLSLRYYRVKRDIYGKVKCLVIHERVKCNELDKKVRDALPTKHGDDEVSYLKLIERQDNGSWEETQWVDTNPLGDDFRSVYGKDNLPYHALTWNLADEADYGTGLVEEYSGDFEAVSELAQAQINGALLASEFRWLANPAGMTSPDDFRNSRNGECLPGQEGDLTLVQAAREVAAALEVQANQSATIINRLGRAFLLSAAVTRDAERVTAEEIRMVAAELESSLGGAYSRIAVDLQLPLAKWLLKAIKVTLKDKQFEPVIVTGLDALSRNGDLENLKLWLQDMVSLATVPPQFLATLNVGAIAAALAAARGINSKQYLLDQAQQQAQTQTAIANQAQAAGAVAQAEQQGTAQ